MLAPFIESALRSLILASVVWAGLRAFSVHNVIAQRTAWTAVLLCSLLMPFVLPFTAHWRPLSFATIQAPASLVHMQSALAPAQTAPSPKRKPSADFARARVPHYRFITPQAAIAETSPSSIRPDIVATDRAQAANAMSAPQFAPGERISFARAVFVLYGLVAAVLFFRLLYGLVSALHLWHSSTPVAPCDAAQLDAGLKLRTSHKISSPVTIGTGIVLPADYTSWTEEKLRIVLAHERSHVSQYDFHLQILASLYAAVAWFSPLGWWLKHKLSDLGEAISDRSGLDVASNRSAYAQILLEFAATPRPTLIGVPMARHSSISRRIERLLNDNYSRLAFTGGAKARIAVLVAPVLLFAAVSLVRVQAASQPAQAPVAPIAAVAPAPPAFPAPAAADMVPPAPPADSVSAILPAPAAPPIADMIPPAAPGNLALPAAALPPAPPAAGEDDSTKWQGAFDRNLSISGKLDLSVATGSGTIRITRGSSSQLHVHGVVKVYRDGDTSRGQQLAANPPIEQNGNTISIGVRHENLRDISIDYEIEAPADAALNASTGSGDITDTGVGENARLTTGSGDIKATGLENGFNIQTGSGNITVDGNGQGDEKVQTGSGEIDVKGVHGAFKAQTGSGDIKVEGTPSASWRLQTGSGSIDLATGSAAMSIDASTGSGEINSSQPMTMQSSENHHHMHAQINGGGPDVIVETGSGDIRVH